MVEETLRHAFRQKVPVRLIYLDRQGLLSERTVRVCTLTREEIGAYCFHRRSYRRLKRDRILAAVVSRDPLQKPSPLTKISAASP
jgi:predicted DNA-binding transcriptional regulator YafY